jgi:4'-phosphopantetheinyl transferase
MTTTTRVIEVSQHPKVWVAVAPLADALALKTASPAEVAHANTLPGRRAAEFLAGRSLLRSLLRQTIGCAAAPIEPDSRGRPVLVGVPRVGVSISHDERFVAACVGRQAKVGVDVQTPPDDVEEPMLRRVLRGQADRLTGSPPVRRAREFTWVWTVQEAVVKARGLGLAGRPWAIDVPLGADGGEWEGYRWVSLRGHSRIPVSCAFTVLAA